jgi:hypothetical protein
MFHFNMGVMRNIYIKIAFILLCTGTFSCKKEFLSLVPQGQQVAANTADYALLMNDPRLARYDYAGGWQGPAIMGDDMAAESSLFNQSQLVTQAAFRWDDQIFRIEDSDFTTTLWLSNLYQLNKVVNEVMQSKGGTEQQKKEILAEALACRAWVYFQLINFYGKPYATTTAAADPGFPIILTSDINVDLFTRGTVQGTYDFIIKDLKDAISSLPINSKNGIHFNKSAAEGLLGKVYLFMGKNAEALALFNAAFTDNAARTQPARLYDYNQEFNPNGKFMPINYDGPSNSPGVNNNDFTESIVSRSFYNNTYGGNGYGNDAFVLAPAAAALFKPTDLRLKFYAAEFPFTQPNPSGRLRKYAYKYTQFGLQISELYLLSVEAKARLNDLSGAKTDLEFLRAKRMSANVAIPDQVAASQSALVKYVFEERIREFAMEGYRWFDMRRESVDPIFSGKTYTHTLFNFNETTGQDAVGATFTLRPQRLTLKLPLFITNPNPNLINNP